MVLEPEYSDSDHAEVPSAQVCVGAHPHLRSHLHAPTRSARSRA